MDNLFLILFLVSFVLTAVFGVRSILAAVKKDKVKQKSQLKLTGIMVAVMIVSVVGFGMTVDAPEEAEEAVIDEPDKEVEVVDEPDKAEPVKEEPAEKKPVEVPVKAPAEKKKDVPREHKNALKAAENYIMIMPFSEKGLYNQLTSNAGDGYPADAAQYAIDNIKVDYNEQALRSAKSYQEIMPMSDQELMNQLTSSAGEQFTQERQSMQLIT